MMDSSAANAQATIQCMKSVGPQMNGYCRMYGIMHVPAINSHKGKNTFRIFKYEKH